MISDDWMATLFVLNDPRYDVQAITVAGTGFATCDAGVTRRARHAGADRVRRCPGRLRSGNPAGR